MQAHQLELKLFFAPDTDLEASALVPIFHRWIQRQRLGDDVLLIDVIDYRHVPQGPGLLLIGDGVQWRIDEAEGELGLVFARRRDPIGDVKDKLDDALECLLRAARALLAEPELAGRFQFRGDRLRVAVHSRLVTAGNAQAFARLEPELRDFAARLAEGGAVAVTQVNEPRQPLAAEVTLARSLAFAA